MHGGIKINQASRVEVLGWQILWVCRGEKKERVPPKERKTTCVKMGAEEKPLGGSEGESADGVGGITYGS